MLRDLGIFCDYLSSELFQL